MSNSLLEKVLFQPHINQKCLNYLSDREFFSLFRLCHVFEFQLYGEMVELQVHSLEHWIFLTERNIRFPKLKLLVLNTTVQKVQLSSLQFPGLVDLSILSICLTHLDIDKDITLYRLNMFSYRISYLNLNTSMLTHLKLVRYQHRNCPLPDFFSDLQPLRFLAIENYDAYISTSYNEHVAFQTHLFDHIFELRIVQGNGTIWPKMYQLYIASPVLTILDIDASSISSIILEHSFQLCHLSLKRCPQTNGSFQCNDQKRTTIFRFPELLSFIQYGYFGDFLAFHSVTQTMPSLQKLTLKYIHLDVIIEKHPIIQWLLLEEVNQVLLDSLPNLQYISISNSSIRSLNNLSLLRTVRIKSHDLRSSCISIVE